MTNFKKAALAGSIVALFGAYNEASATAIGDPDTSVILGCTVPGNTTAGATVYSVDAYDANAAALTGLPTWLKSGASCSRAVNWMLSATGGGSDLATVRNQVGNNGYTLQSFNFIPNGSAAQNADSVAVEGVAVSMIGCALPASGTAGAAIYSVDGQNSLASTANTGITLSALSSTPCSSGLATTLGLSGGTGIIDAELNVRTADGAYSLEQFIIQ